jgi:predicted metal-dependent HD superfamily phosphohydrolase
MLSQIFEASWSTCNFLGDWRRNFSALLQRYSEPHRFYHDWTHIEFVVTELNSHRANVLDIIAAFYHDVIYDIPSRDTNLSNEQLSAQFFRDTVYDPNATNPLVTEVSRLIEQTGDYCTKGSQSALGDADLVTLAQPYEDYRAEGRLIRKEWSHLSDEDFKRGRQQFLQAMTKQQIFSGKLYSAPILEMRAQANLKRELKEMNDGTW